MNLGDSRCFKLHASSNSLYSNTFLIYLGWHDYCPAMSEDTHLGNKVR
ncbi:hypothetical protein NKDENANG_00057 [Candidatus Entotheonellaceae bacterium PAL068K]